VGHFYTGADSAKGHGFKSTRAWQNCCDVSPTGTPNRCEFEQDRQVAEATQRA